MGNAEINASGALLACLSIAACIGACATVQGEDQGPGGGGGSGGGSGAGGSSGAGGTGSAGATLRGTVWAPGNAPGLVPSNQEIPVHHAVISASRNQPAPPSAGARCNPCQTLPTLHTFSDEKGSFSISSLEAGTQWITIQKGGFRVDIQVTLGAGETRTLTDAESTLPSTEDPEAGRWLPRIAIALGQYDRLEEILGKMGLGSIDSSGALQEGSLSDVVHIYENGSRDVGPTEGTLTELVSNPSLMLEYSLILIPGSGSAHTAALQAQTNLRNIRDYIEAGGTLYTTAWSGEWADNVFPAFVTLGDNGADTPATAFDQNTVTWNTAQFGNADGANYTSPATEAVDSGLFAWLDGQIGPLVGGGTGSIDAGSFAISESWNLIVSESDTTTWVTGGAPGSEGKLPMAVSYEPVGCGRVAFSVNHATDRDVHPGLVPQERLALYTMLALLDCQP